MRKSTVSLSAASLAVCGLSAISATAASSGSDMQKDPSNQHQSMSDHNRPKDQDASGARSDSRQSQQSSNWRLDPEGWVAVGYDWDKDGKFDAIEMISAYDLQQARRRSRERGTAMQQSTGRNMRQTQGSGSMPGPQRRLQGEIMSLKHIDIVGLSDSALVAKVRTESGRTNPVFLGPEQQLKRLNLGTGDRVSLTVRPGKLNDQSVLVASRIRSNGQSVAVRTPREAGILRKFSGEIQDTKTATNQRTGKEHRFAKVRLDSGRTSIVDLGPERAISGAELQAGDSISFLAKPAKANGRACLKAAQFSTGGQRFDTGFVQSGTQASAARARW